MNGKNQVKLTMSNLKTENIVVDSIYQAGDSIKINLKKYNRLEEYSLPEYSFILPEIIDTSGPKVINSIFNFDSLIINFSEPVNITSNAVSYK